MKRTVLFWIAKPSFMAYGGNDNCLLHLIAHWPDDDERLILAVNAGNPCEKIFRERLSGRATVEAVRAPMTVEARRRIGEGGGSRLREFLYDLTRPFRAAAAVARFCGYLRRRRPDALLVNVGGNPPEDAAWRLLIAARLCRVPRVLLVNHIYPGVAVNFPRRLALAALRRLTKYLCDVLITPSRDCGEVVARSMADARPPVCIPYGIEADPAEAPLEERRKRLGLSGDAPVVGVVANLEPRKGVLHLVRAMGTAAREFPSARLVIVGALIDPVHVEEIRREIAAQGLADRTTVTGPLPEAGQYFACFDVGVVPSVRLESFGIVAIEAMRAVKPVVSSRMGGLAEVIVDGESGIQVPPGDEAALAAAIARLLRDPALREKMGRAGRERFLKLYTPRPMAEAYHRETFHGKR